MWKFSSQIGIDFLFLGSAMGVQQKIVLIMSGLSPLELGYNCNHLPCVVGLVVRNMFSSGCLACPLIITIDIGSSHPTTVTIRPGQLMKC